MGGLHQEARRLQPPYRAAHGHGIAVFKAVGIQKPHLPPGFAHGPGNPIGGRIVIVHDHDIDQEKPAPVQPRFHQPEKTICEQMRRNDGLGEGIQNDGVITGPGPAQKSRPVLHMAIHCPRHVEIASRDLEGQRVDVRQGHPDAYAGQHGGQGTARTSDHQDVTRALLQHQAEQGMDILGQADAKTIGDALVILRLPIGNPARAVVLGQNDFGGGQAWLASAATYRPRRNT